MAEVSTFVGRDVWGSKCMTYGTWTAGAVTTGEIDTKLHRCEQLLLQPNNNTSPAEQCQVSSTLPIAGSAVGIVITSNVDGYWMALGDAFV
uniref:Uncharacterized protein n=1 Tax=viral metagenome TaxID=1070528 RepID=A0A6M3KNZ7_9ZZZZ